MEKTEFEKHFSQALKAGQKRDYRKAIAILEYLAAQGEADGEAGHPEVYLYLARAWHVEEMYSRATACARSFIRLRPDDGSGWFFLGRSYLAEGRYDRAVSALKRSVECNPSSLDARALLGMSYLKGRKPTLARGVFEDALALAPDDPRLNQGYLNALFVEAVRTFRRGDPETARQMLTFLINNDIDGVAPRLYLAHALRDLGYLPEALSQYEAATQFEPEDAALRWYPVAMLLELGDAEEAARRMAEFGESLPEGGSSDRMVSLVIIRNHLDKEEWGKAIEAARAYIKKYGSDAQAHALMGEALRNLGNLRDSLTHFNRALELDRENPAPRYGILMLLAGARDWGALLAETQRAARAGCDADTVGYYQVLARANLDENPEDVLPGIQEQVRAHGAVPELLVALGRTYFRLGLADLALGWYRKVTELEEGNEEAWLGYIASCEELSLSGADADSAHAAAENSGSGKAARGSQAGDSRERIAVGEELGDAYSAYLERWGDNAAIRNDYIAWLVANERWESAADNTERLEDYADSEQLIRQLAFYRRKAGQFRQAAVLYRNMLRKKPDDRVLLANLVFCLDRMGESSSALRLMKEANKAFKPNADSLLIEGRLYARTGDFDQALVVFRKVMDSYPDDPRGWEESSAIYARQGVKEMADLLAQKARDVRVKAEKRAQKKARDSGVSRDR